MRRRGTRFCMFAGLVTALLPWTAGGAEAHDEHRTTSTREGRQLAAARAGGEDRLVSLLPNLRSVPPKDFSIEMRNGYRWLRFESALGNTGEGPLETRPDRRQRCPRGQEHASQIIYQDVDGSGRFKRSVDTSFVRRSAGCMIFHPRHDHWHFDAASRYLLQPAEGTRTVTKHRKTSFCLRDSARLPVPWGASKSYGEYYGYCDSDNPQGISIGWSDIYQSFLPGQALRLPNRMPNGRYCVGVKVDPLDQLRETDDSDNTSFRAVRIRNRTVAPIERRWCS